jgi:putative methyltransferase (TIGR04325 family)
VIEAAVRWALNVPFATLRDWRNERRFRQRHLEPVYSGVYPTFEAAIASLPKEIFVGFDDETFPDFYLEYHFGLNPYDYPMLFWLKKIYRPGTNIFDFGGGIGQCRYAYEPFLELTEQLGGAHWTVCDLPAFVKRGGEIAAEKGVTDLHFTSDFKQASEAGVFITNGALQYLPKDLPEMLTDLERLPEHVLINRIPGYDGPGYYTVQNTRHRSYTPYRIINREAFRAGMAALGYRQEDNWGVPRKLHVNFHPECDVEKYQGFYFRLDTSANSVGMTRQAALSAAE